MDKLYFTCWKV